MTSPLCSVADKSMHHGGCRKGPPADIRFQLNRDLNTRADLEKPMLRLCSCLKNQIGGALSNHDHRRIDVAADQIGKH
jgi:hypothetical protein